MRWLVLLLSSVACGANANPSPTKATPASGRTVCGWESLEDARPEPGERRRPNIEGPITLSLKTGTERADPGTQVLVLEVEPALTFAAVRDALAPAADTLVRIKVLFGGRWLLPMTSRGRVPVKPPPKSETVESVVGRRILRRPRGAPADRFADVRLDGGELRLYVENENPAGVRLRVGELRTALRRVDPPATVFALTATDDTPWRELAATLVAAACYDRGPEEEPHEVILD